MNQLKILCKLYDKSDENINVDALLKVCFFKNVSDVLELCSHHKQIRFCYLCVELISNLFDNCKFKFTCEKFLSDIKMYLNGETKTFIFNNDFYFSGHHNCVNLVCPGSVIYPTSRCIDSIYEVDCIYFSNKVFERCVKIGKIIYKLNWRYKLLGFLIQVIEETEK